MQPSTNDDLTAVLALLAEPDLTEDPETAQVRALIGIGHALLAVAEQLRRIRNELTATRLS
jgi:hypothetical protein